MDNEITVLDDLSIKDKIFTIRGTQVMLDNDLAQIYGVDTRVFNQAVKRNIERFPEKFRFQLTREEHQKLVENCNQSNLRSQFVTSSGHGGRRYFPYAFTEKGVKILSEILKRKPTINFLFNTPQNNHLTIPSKPEIASKIYVVRGLQVMLDYDLAELYDVKAIRLREQVKRNLKRFPEDFMYQLSEEEIDIMVSQNAIPSKQKLGGARPYVFSEQGIASLSSVLTSDKAIEVNIKIMRAFVAMRKVVQHHSLIFQRLDNIEQKHLELKLDSDAKFNKIFDAIEAKGIKPKQGIFFEGQIFDAYVFVSGLVKSAENSIVLIDNYVDETVLTLLSKRKKKCSAIIYTKNISKKLELDLKKHNEQYSPVEMHTFPDAHDRFLILDENEIFHIGASLKDLGKKWFAFSKFKKGALQMLDKLERENKDG